MRRAPHMPAPNPTMLTQKAVMIPTCAPAHQPMELPTVVVTSDMILFIGTGPACGIVVRAGVDRGLP